MSKLLSLGAINIITGKYVYPKIASKKEQYICCECSKDLILCQGDIRACYFRHKVDDENPCNHYGHPTESQIHKDAKTLLKTILEQKILITCSRNCVSCKIDEQYEIPLFTESSRIQLEYRFEYNGTKIADVAYIDNDELICIFEICNTHKTSSEDRPEPWFEIDAETIIKIANKRITGTNESQPANKGWVFRNRMEENTHSMSSLQIPCMRYETCDECIKKETLRSYASSSISLHSIPENPVIASTVRSGDSSTMSFDDNDMSGAFASLRRAKKHYKNMKSGSIISYLDKEDVKYEEYNHIIIIKHTISKISIRRSTVNSKTYINGKWVNIDLVDIVTWYKTTDGVIIQCTYCNYLCKKINNIIMCMKCKSDICMMP